MAPGILYVTMQPAAALDRAAFQDWYNNEHGPLRLRLSPHITNGFRYRALDLDNNASTDSKPHEFMAIYDLPDMNFLDSEDYLKLRSHLSKALENNRSAPISLSIAATLTKSGRGQAPLSRLWRHYPPQTKKTTSS